MTWLAVGLYATAAIVLGWRARSRTASGADFWTAGRRLGTASVGLSISAGFMSVSWSCVYAVQLYYWYGLGAAWLITVPWLLALGGIFLLARRYHALPDFSQPEMVGRRLGPPARRIVASSLALVFLVWGGAEIYVAATLLAPGLGISIPATIVGIGVVVGIYATLGGFRAVVTTDRLQYLLVAFYILAMAWLAWAGMRGEGGAILPDPGVSPLKSDGGWTRIGSPGVALVFLSFLAYLPGWVFETDLWLRVQAAGDEQAARRGMLLAGGNALLFVGLLPMFIGVAALALFPPVAGVAPAGLGNEGDAIFAALVSAYAPPWLSGLVAVGLVAAAMSTIDTCANVTGLSVGYDLLRVQERPDAIRRSRFVTAGAVAASCLFALNTDSLWDVFYLSGGVLTTTVAFPVAAVFLPGVSSRGVTWSAAAGLVGTVVGYFLEESGTLAPVEPAWMEATGLGYIFLALLAAGGGYLAGARGDPRSP